MFIGPGNYGRYPRNDCLLVPGIYGRYPRDDCLLMDESNGRYPRDDCLLMDGIYGRYPREECILVPEKDFLWLTEDPKESAETEESDLIVPDLEFLAGGSGAIDPVGAGDLWLMEPEAACVSPDPEIFWVLDPFFLPVIGLLVERGFRSKSLKNPSLINF